MAAMNAGIVQTVNQHKAPIITITLLSYVALYLFFGVATTTFQAQPAAATYHLGFCGDGSCQSSLGEDCASCQSDCGLCAGCGDGTCGLYEDPDSCPQDCGGALCGDGTCQASEDCSSCATDCGACGCFFDSDCADDELCSWTAGFKCRGVSCPLLQCDDGTGQCTFEDPTGHRCQQTTETCSDIEGCMVNAGCVDCGDPFCNGYQYCTYEDGNPCYCGTDCNIQVGECSVECLDNSDCPVGQTCNPSTYQCELCTNECDPANYPQCTISGSCPSGVGTNSCRDTDGDGCFELQAPSDCCANNEVCSSGFCTTCGNGVCDPGEDCRCSDCDCPGNDPTCTSALGFGSSYACVDCDWDGDNHRIDDGGFICGGNDCADTDDTRYPGAPEICDGKDNDCDGIVDEGGGGCGGGSTCSGGSCCADENNDGTCDYCGDSYCDSTETSGSCSADCSGGGGGGDWCGDGTCDPGETASSCYTDCGSCGDGTCNGPETTGTCYTDCGSCGDGICTNPPEDSGSCSTDCGGGGTVCGDGVCEGGETASSCYTDCGSCGDGTCNGPETTGTCYTDCGSCGDGTCSGPEDTSSCYTDCGSCGDGTCSGPEDGSTCYPDCGSCGDGICSGPEDASSCYTDCGSCGDGICNGPEDASTCATDCSGACTDACSPGSYPQCTGPASGEDCADIDGDGCTEITTFSCGGGQVCSSGSCTASSTLSVVATADQTPSNDAREEVIYTMSGDTSGASCSASGAGVSWNCGGSPSGTCTPQSDISDGSYSVTVSCSNSAGESDSDNAALTIDTVAPSVTVSGAPAGWVNTVQTATVSCSDTGSGCDTTTYQLEKWADGTEPVTCPTTYSSYSLASPHDVYAHVWMCAAAKDAAGNVGTGGASPNPLEFQVDTTSPNPSLSATTPTNDNQERVTFQDPGENLASASASGGTDTSGNPMSWSCTLTGSDDGHCDPDTQLQDGTHTITITLTDQAGNTGSDTITITVDTQPPSITCAECDSPDPVRGGSTVRFTPSVDGTGTGITQIDVCRDSSCSSTYCDYAPPATSCSYTTPTNVYTTNQYWIRAVDEAGNTATQPSGAITPPSFTIKKGIGSSCRSDQECLLGTCTNNQCTVSSIPPPEITLTSYTGDEDVAQASVTGSLTKRQLTYLKPGDTRTLEMQLGNPLPVPDMLLVQVTGSAVAEDVVSMSYPGSSAAIECFPGDDACRVVVDENKKLPITFELSGSTYGRGDITVSVTSAATERSSHAQKWFGVKEPLFDRFSRFFGGIR